MIICLLVVLVIFVIVVVCIYIGLTAILNLLEALPHNFLFGTARFYIISFSTGNIAKNCYCYRDKLNCQKLLLSS